MSESQRKKIMKLTDSSFCSIGCGKDSSKKRKDFQIEFSDNLIHLCKFQHLKSPKEWLQIVETGEKLTPTRFDTNFNCVYLEHVETNNGVTIKHVSKKNKETKLELVSVL